MEQNDKQSRIEEMREKLANVSGERYWKGLEELCETQEFKTWLEDEFPQRASIPDVDRRTFLKLAGASLALAGLAGCRSLPEERIVPYVKAPEERLPGQVLSYASAFPFEGYGLGILVTSNEGRPTKIEGNDRHPASLGSTDVFAQAEILNMYDPDRSQSPSQVFPGQESYPCTWEAFLQAARSAFEAELPSGGAGLRILTEAVTSPTLYAQIKAIQAKYKNAKWYQYQPVNRDNERKGSLAAFGEIVDPQYDLTKAKVLLCLDSDILGCKPNNIRYIRDFMSKRTPAAGMNRVYSIETTFSRTGSFADHRMAVKPSDFGALVQYIAASVGVACGPGSVPNGLPASWIASISKDLLANKGKCLVVAGDSQPAGVHALVHSMNHVLGNVGNTLAYSDPVEVSPAVHYEQLAQLTAEMSSGQVNTLVILGGNPVYTAPTDIPFAKALQSMSGRKQTVIHHSLYEDETSALCSWHSSESHFLESWGDLRSIDGTNTLVQPLIMPLFDTRSSIELLSDLNSDPQSGYNLTRKTWSHLTEREWRDALERGFVETPPPAPKAVTPKIPSASDLASPRPQGGPIDAVFEADPTVYDGRYANNGWLQELPKPITKLSWDNAVIVGPNLAVQLGVLYQDNVEVSSNGSSVIAPIFVLPGVPDGTVILHLGGGRQMAGKVGNNAGFDFYPLRSTGSLWFGSVDIKKAGTVIDLATSQVQHSMIDRDVVREGSYADYLQNPSLEPLEARFEDPNSILYNLTEEWRQENPDIQQWGMTIDLNTCTGCGACEVACQAENNIPTVGKEEVQRGRIMHWIRVDRYFRVTEGVKERDFDEPIAEVEAIGPTDDQGAMNPNSVRIVCMPVPCMHCETAPCEPVCPVAATIHSHEGLNQMVYNRCVGTRYCSNNCPYKVRRFNFFNFQFRQPQFVTERDITLLNLMTNPDVTVRSRGVMEKCSYCVQRINEARITAKKENRKIRDGEVVPACAQACPSKAIVFGDISDATAKVTKLKADKRNYGLFEDLNTRPRTTYLVKIRNLNPELAKQNA